MVTKTTILALRTLIHIARNGAGRILAVRDVATELNESPTYTAKLARQLVKAGILRSDRGAQGGVYLARQPRAITLLEIVRACQGEIVGDYCQTGCPPQTICSFHQAALELEQAIVDVLGRWDLEQLMKHPFATHGRRDLPCVMAKSVQLRREPGGASARV